LNSSEVVQAEARNSAFYRFLENVTGLPHLDIKNVYNVYDILFCQQNHQIALPDWAFQNWTDGLTVFQKLAQLNAYFYQIQFNRMNESLYTGGPLLNLMVQNMKSKLNSTLNISTGMYAYTAHDTTMTALLTALGVYNGIVPRYATAIMLELSANNGQNFVQVVYLNDTTTYQPYTLVLPGCTAQCEWSKFISLVQRNIPTNWQQQCNQ